MDGLTEDQLDKLRQFQEITNVDEPEMAMCSLASLDWNLERAIEAHLSESFGGEPAQAPSPIPVVSQQQRWSPPQQDAASSSAAAYDPFEDEPMEVVDEEAAIAAAIAASTRAATMRVPFAPRLDTGRSRAGGAGVSRSSGAVAARTRSQSRSDSDDESYDFAMENDPDEESAHSRRTAHASNGGSHARTNNDNSLPLIPVDCQSAIDGTQNFQSVFEARYGQNGRSHLMPPFFCGSLPAAIREAFECPDRPVCERRPLALYIHHDKSIARNIFPNNVLCADGVCQLLRSQFVLWPWDVTTKENEEKLIQFLTDSNLYDVRPMVARFMSDVDRFPLLVLLSKEGSSIRLVDVVVGPDSAETAVEKLLTCMEAYASMKVTLEKQEQERIDRERLRQEQEQELQESLAVDRERVAKQKREEAEAREREESARRAKEELEAHRAALKAALPAEPAEGSPECVQVRFRLPEAGQALRRFSKLNPLSVVLSYLESEGYPVSDYRMMNSEFPQKKDVSAMDANALLADLKWPAREVINVEER